MLSRSELTPLNELLAAMTDLRTFTASRTSPVATESARTSMPIASSFPPLPMFMPPMDSPVDEVDLPAVASENVASKIPPR